MTMSCIWIVFEKQIVLRVVFQKWRWPFLHRPSKGIAVDKQANHDVMHLRGFREADRLANQAFDACPQCQVLALDFLRVAFAWAVLVGVEVTRVGPPIIGIIAAQPEGLQQRFEPQKDLIFAAPKDVGQDLAGVVIDGMPEPAWVALVPDKRPHLIHLRLRFPSALQVPSHLGGVQRAQYSRVHRLQRRFFLLEFPQHRVGTDMQRARCITYPTGIKTHVDDHVLDLWQASAVAIVEQKTARGTQGVLAEVALGTPGRFPASDNLVTLTVRAADGDERHGPFLPMRSYEDKAQCDIHLSPSPLLKHYRSAILYECLSGTEPPM